MTAYATAADLYRHGCPRALLSDDRRAVTADASTNAFTLDAHGFEAGDVVEFFGTTLPSPLASATSYYVVEPTASTFKVAATSGGSAVDLTTAGSADLDVVLSLATEITEALEQASRLVDTYVVGHVVPFESPFPPFVVWAVAKVAARELLTRRGRRDDLIFEAADRALSEVRRMTRGVTMRDVKAPEQATVASWSASASPFETVEVL